MQLTARCLCSRHFIAGASMDRIFRLWYRVRATFWFLPTLIVSAAVILAFAAIEADSRFVASGALERWPRVFGAGASASRSMLDAVAGSMITVAGTVFSITLVALSLASSQYSSRVLRNFMADRANQSVLGIFVGIFAYCLVVLRSIHGEGESAFIPSVAVLGGLLLGFGGIGVLVFFIHHIAQSIQASRIIDAVRGDTFEAIDRLFPHRFRCDAVRLPASPDTTWHAACHVTKGGYLQFVDYDRLGALARAHGVRLKVHPRVGDYLLAGDRLLSATPTVPDGLDDALARCWSIGRQRTLEQDIDFGIRQLVDVALRALSPGINDTTTAVMCIDACTAVLRHAVTQDLRFDGCERDGVAWIETRHPVFGDLLDDAFDQIRHAARDNVVVLERLRWSLAALADATPEAEHRDPLKRHALRIQHTVEQQVQDPEDRTRLQTALIALQRQL
ncbi:DUF2254 domain-containing protein [Luteimonas sp. WGS1318]|uniref:DUF2254 domain-containing protein n=1 Tax=Luteimonas sp. WGS1318 TaxID=3366815 RepID=UPI00372D22FF